MDDTTLKMLENYLYRVPAIGKSISFGFNDNSLWWAKFRIDIRHALAWQVVQEIGCVCNYLSLNERLPTVFFPVSPAPYLNGGPENFLSWVIETTDKAFTPALLVEWLEGRLPRPVEDLSQWMIDED
ncbi:hypothetical protein [Larkinella rosea]|uniref:Uncharacterized protein n=1 Tax=Larkinella rosea TaxID=2025312 RepID=A0A3P1BGJ3_9BACT|nr:hypothetical protein [Larkinella rosea]RRB00135.1 hypothetical protein EHT25_26285 [Larkinella rosea]